MASVHVAKTKNDMRVPKCGTVVYYSTVLVDDPALSDCANCVPEYKIRDKYNKTLPDYSVIVHYGRSKRWSGGHSHYRVTYEEPDGSEFVGYFDKDGHLCGCT